MKTKHKSMKGMPEFNLPTQLISDMKPMNNPKPIEPLSQGRKK